MFAFYLAMDRDVDSMKLWKEINAKGANVIDTGKEVWVHGTASIPTLSSILEICSMYGQVDGEIHLVRR